MTAELDPLDAVIDRIRRSAPPADGWPRARRRAALLVIGAFAMLIRQQRGEPIVPLPAPAPAPEVVRGPDPQPEPPTPKVPSIPVVPDRDGVGFGGQPPPPRGMAGTYAAPRVAVADAAAVLVSTADAAPLKLGGTVPAGHVGERIHVWNWEKSDTSRVLDATCKVSFAVSPDGTRLVTADGRVIDLAAGTTEPLAWWGERKLRPAWLRFAPDGKTLLAFEHDQKTGTARLLDYPAGTERARVTDLWWAASKAAFTADGKTVVLYGSDAHLRSFDAATGKEKVRFAPAFANTIRAIAVTADGLKVAGSYNGTVRIWDAAGKLLCEPDTKDRGPPADVTALVFTPDGKQLAGGGSTRLTVWNAADGGVAKRFEADSYGAGHLRFDATGSELTTVKDTYIRGGRQGGADAVTVYPTVERWRVGLPPGGVVLP